MNELIPDNSLYISKDVFIKNSMFYLEPYIKLLRTFLKGAKLEKKINDIQDLELVWYDFDYIFNKLRPIYGSIMNYLEINVFNKDNNFRTIVNRQYEHIINTVKII